MNAISLKRVVKTFGEHRAVDDLSFEIPTGVIFGLLGRNGAGKTTTIRMMLDIIRPDAGQLEVLGGKTADGAKDRIGYLPEERGLYPKMKVREMLAFQAAIKGLAHAEGLRRADGWLERLELGAWRDKKVEELSKGMAQKVQFIAAVLAEPELLILDEPFSGMDPVNQDVFKDLILEMNRAGSTVVFSTHVMESAERLCHEIALIDTGRAVLHGAITSIKERFGKNALRLEFEGNGAFLAGLPVVEHFNDYGQHVELQLVQGADEQEVLRAAVGRLRIRRFEIVAPSLHNIFVQQVGGEDSDA